jgi:hypothetical protein
VAAAAEFCAKGRVHLPAPAYAREHHGSWLETAETEIFSYPEGNSDDITDALCQLIFWVQQQEARMQRVALPEPMVWGENREVAQRV